MTDYPDYTSIMQIIGSDIMVPIDLQGAYIMMPVDIQAQYVNVDVDVVAQTIGNIKIDLAAQSMGAIGIDITAQTVGVLSVGIAAAVTLNVDIAAQTIGNLTIDIEAQSVGLYSMPEWAAKTATDINQVGGSAAIGTNTYGTVKSATVPTGQYWYITDFWISILNPSNCLSDKVFGFVLGTSSSPSACQVGSGGVGGAHAHLNKPRMFPPGSTIYLVVSNFTAYDSTYIGGFLGYVIIPG